MNFKFKMKNGKILKAFYNDLFYDKEKKTYGVVSIGEHKNGHYKEYVRTVRIDENEKRFFTWNKETFYLDNFIALTPEELVEQFDTEGKNVYGEELCTTLLKHGINSLHLMIRTKPLDILEIPGLWRLTFKTSSNFDKDEDYIWVEYKFIEEYLRMPKDNYKLKVIPANEKEAKLYPKEDYYVSDLTSLLCGCKDKFKLVVA